ncbi:MAG: HAD family phosphatase [Verrucomicrobiaceae bacterium]|nr:HAD family phosphatase [Verrucomicrobiaceae bacterium]
MSHAYLFDIGNVIITFDFGRAARKLAPLAAVEAEEALRLVTPLMQDLELGRLAPEAFVAKASEMIGYTGDPDFFQRAFADIFELNQPMVEFIEERKAAGSRLYLLSNTNGIHVPFFESTYPVFGHFDGRVYSHEVGLMKPDPRIYTLVRERFSLVPEQTIYIDDLAANCEAGKAAGFLGVPYSHRAHEDFLSSVASVAQSS